MSMIMCDACKNKIASEGIQFKKMEAGEFEVKYFCCPHCGKEYFVSCTDEEQRMRNLKLLQMRRKKTLGIQKKFKKSTLDKYDRQAKKIAKKNRTHNIFLRRVGKRLLAGDDIETILDDIGGEEIHDQTRRDKVPETLSPDRR